MNRVGGGSPSKTPDKTSREAAPNRERRLQREALERLNKLMVRVEKIDNELLHLINDQF
jgi:hypothetical protein